MRDCLCFSQNKEIRFHCVYRKHILISRVNPSQTYSDTSRHKILVIARATQREPERSDCLTTSISGSESLQSNHNVQMNDVNKKSWR